MPILTDVVALSAESHQRVEVECDYKLSPRCPLRWNPQYRDARKTLERNEGKIICTYCSKTYKFTGRTNPNCKYKSLDDDYFSEIDTDFKAYLLGWIASDGNVARNGTITIRIHEKDLEILEKLRNRLNAELPLKKCKNDTVALAFSSKRMRDDICRWLQIEPGKKDAVIGFPQLSSDDLKWAFIRGYFDGDGSVSDPLLNQKRYPLASIASYSDKLRKAIYEFVNIPGCLSDEKLEWSHSNALDFLCKIYEPAPFALQRKLQLYYIWSHWKPSLKGHYGDTPSFKWTKSDARAVAPFKQRASDSGYDLTLIDVVKKSGNVIFYTTGIKITPEYGYYFDLVPRSSITKTGYIFAHSIGIIDRSYTGPILIPLIKLDPSSPELELPARIVQIIPREIIHFEFEEVESLDETSRNEGGFGSTN